MFPPHIHIHLQLFVRAGIHPTITLLAGNHGAVILGIQGMGVRPPIAAAVADATVGFAIDWHIPNGRIFTIGAKSIIVAWSIPPNIGRDGSITINEDGAMPKEH